MKILLVQEADWLERGPHQSHHLMERLSKKNHEVRVIDFPKDWRQSKTHGIFSRRMVFHNKSKAVPGGNITVIRPMIIELPILEYISLLITHRREIKKQIREFKPDVIVGFGILNAYIAIRLAKKHNIPFVYYIIDELFRLVPQKNFQKLARQIERNNVIKADKILSINEALRQYTIQMGADEKKTMVVSAGIDLERFNPEIYNSTTKPTNIQKGKDVVLFFMGWLYDFSGLKEIALELSKSIEKYPHIKLFVVGKGDLYDELHRIKQEKLGDRLTLMDWQPYDKIPQLIADSDICILPAHNNEIMQNIVPIKLYEYMAMEKPVIATSLPGLMKEFGEQNGVLYVDSPHQVLEKATQIASTQMISDEGMKARKFVEQNDWDTITKDFENILSGLI
jgi:glycosyltransferase involved in cell wall biosynthesis